MELLYSFIFSLILILLAWCIYLRVNNAGLIDVFWGLNITGIGLINLLARQFDMLSIFAMVLLILWGARLTLFLFVTRILKGKHDQRYEDISSDWKNKKFGFLAQYLFQGVLAWVIALPFFTLSYVGSMGFITIGSTVLISLGIIGESLADLQLYKHVQNHKGAVCETGAWRYSRHPNYFFECLVWLGFSILGSSAGIGMLSFLSIIMLFGIMWFITIPITENASLKKRGRIYEAYISKTSCFIPWFPKG